VKIDIIQLYMYLSKDRTWSVYLHKGFEDLFLSKGSTTNCIVCSASLLKEISAVKEHRTQGHWCIFRCGQTAKVPSFTFLLPIVSSFCRMEKMVQCL